MRGLFVLILVSCAQPPPPPAPAPAPAPAPTSAPASASASASADASAPSPAEQALVAALKKDHASLLSCQRDAKDAKGDMTIRVVIGVNGKVEATAIAANPTVPMSLAQCIEARVRALRVDIQPTTVDLPFHFRLSPYDGRTVFYGSGPFDPGY